MQYEALQHHKNILQPSRSVLDILSYKLDLTEEQTRIIDRKNKLAFRLIEDKHFHSANIDYKFPKKNDNCCSQIDQSSQSESLCTLDGVNAYQLGFQNPVGCRLAQVPIGRSRAPIMSVNQVKAINSHFKSMERETIAQESQFRNRLEDILTIAEKRNATGFIDMAKACCKGQREASLRIPNFPKRKKQEGKSRTRIMSIEDSIKERKSTNNMNQNLQPKQESGFKTMRERAMSSKVMGQINEQEDLQRNRSRQKIKLSLEIKPIDQRMMRSVKHERIDLLDQTPRQAKQSKGMDSTFTPSHNRHLSRSPQSKLNSSSKRKLDVISRLKNSSERKGQYSDYIKQVSPGKREMKEQIKGSKRMIKAIASASVPNRYGSIANELHHSDGTKRNLFNEFTNQETKKASECSIYHHFGSKQNCIQFGQKPSYHRQHTEDLENYTGKPQQLRNKTANSNKNANKNKTTIYKQVFLRGLNNSQNDRVAHLPDSLARFEFKKNRQSIHGPSSQHFTITQLEHYALQKEHQSLQRRAHSPQRKKIKLFNSVQETKNYKNEIL